MRNYRGQMKKLTVFGCTAFQPGLQVHSFLVFLSILDDQTFAIDLNVARLATYCTFLCNTVTVGHGTV